MSASTVQNAKPPYLRDLTTMPPPPQLVQDNQQIMEVWKFLAELYHDFTQVEQLDQKWKSIVLKNRMKLAQRSSGTFNENSTPKDAKLCGEAIKLANQIRRANAPWLVLGLKTIRGWFNIEWKSATVEAERLIMLPAVNPIMDLEDRVKVLEKDQFVSDEVDAYNWSIEHEKSSKNYLRNNPYEHRFLAAALDHAIRLPTSEGFVESLTDEMANVKRSRKEWNLIKNYVEVTERNQVFQTEITLEEAEERLAGIAKREQFLLAEQARLLTAGKIR